MEKADLTERAAYDVRGAAWTAATGRWLHCVFPVLAAYEEARVRWLTI